MSEVRTIHVQSLHRYPVKSLGGETLMQAEVNARGLVGDRYWAVENNEGKFGSGKSTHRFRQMNGLLEYRARYEGETPMLLLPDGTELDATSAEAARIFSRRTGQSVTVTAEQNISHFDEGAIHLLTTSNLNRLAQQHGKNVDVRRFRPNILLNTGTHPQDLESGWIGKHLKIGETLVLQIAYLMPRCVMVNMPQHDLPEDEGILKSIAKLSPDVEFGALAHVLQPGMIKPGDEVRVIS